MPDHSLGWTANKRADRRARARLAGQLFAIFLSLVGLWAGVRLGWDFVEHMPAADMGAW